MNKKGVFKNILKFISDLISWSCLCILIIIGVSIIWYVISARIYASRGEEYKPYFSLYTIISPSMEPNIKVYDVILDARVDDVNQIKKGDIITFISTGSLSNGMTITHRVVDVIQDEYSVRFKTKGDNNQTADAALVESGNVLGKALFRIPQLGRVQYLLGSKGGWIIIIVLPALAVIIYDGIKLFKTSTLKEKVENMLSTEEEDLEEKKKREEKRKKELKEKLRNRIKR